MGPGATAEAFDTGAQREVESAAVWRSDQCFESAVSKQTLGLRAEVHESGTAGWRTLVEDLDSGMSSHGESWCYGWLSVVGGLQELAVGLRGERVRLMPEAFEGLRRHLADDSRGAHVVIRDGDRVLIAAGDAEPLLLPDIDGRGVAWSMLRPGAGSDALAERCLARFESEVFVNAPRQCAVAVEDLEAWVAEGRCVQVYNEHPCLAGLGVAARGDDGLERDEPDELPWGLDSLSVL